MLSKIALAASMASTVFALPQSSQPQPATNGFIMTAIHSGDISIHQRPITANGYSFWIGKPTASYCGSTAEECAEYNGTTTVVSAGTAGPAYLPIYTTGFQQLYVDQLGNLKYSEGHADAVPEGSVISPFTYTDNENGTWSFTLPGKNIYACPAGEDIYSIKTDVYENFDSEGCVIIAISAYPAQSDVYQYI